MKPVHIAVLNANTDRSRFASQHPRDGEKFRILLHEVRPGWEVTDFDVTAETYPEDWAEIDGAIITGSPASAAADDAWILRLLQDIRDLDAQNIPIFGVCFGHQAIARALGGRVVQNHGPFVLGIVEANVTNPAPWMTPAPPSFRIAAAHGEQVDQLPPAAVVNSTGAACPVAGFHIGQHIFTSEYHPEMTHHFIGSLTEAMARKSDANVIKASRASMGKKADRALFAKWIAAFFETANGQT